MPLEILLEREPELDRPTANRKSYDVVGLWLAAFVARLSEQERRHGRNVPRPGYKSRSAKGFRQGNHGKPRRQ